MNTYITLLILTLFLALSKSKSKPTHHHGFTLDLIHRDSPLSPLYNPTYSLTDRLQNAFLRSMSRVTRLSTLGLASNLKMDADIFGVPYEYIMKIQIGTPPVQVFGIADTGSDLTWSQCEPCKNCFNQGSLPLLVPNSSTTYQAQTCQSRGCEALDGNIISCDSKDDICQYKMTYGDTSYSIGELAMDTFWFGRTSFKRVIFGCGHDNNGTFPNVSGIIGLGGGPLSIINQLSHVIKGKFSYCLIPQFKFNETTSKIQTSKIHFGDGVNNLSGPNVVSTPLINKRPSTFYYVTLESVLVGNKNLSCKQLVSRAQEEGNIIVDSGTTLTFLPREIYSEFASALTKAIGSATVQEGDLDICYKHLNLSRVPKVTFRFKGADVEIAAENMFVEADKGLRCLTIVPTDDLSVFGNLLQANLMVEFDLVNQNVCFKPTDCTMQ